MGIAGLPFEFGLTAKKSKRSRSPQRLMAQAEAAVLEYPGTKGIAGWWALMFWNREVYQAARTLALLCGRKVLAYVRIPAPPTMRTEHPTTGAMLSLEVTKLPFYAAAKAYVQSLEDTRIGPLAICSEEMHQAMPNGEPRPGVKLKPIEIPQLLNASFEDLVALASSSKTDDRDRAATELIPFGRKAEKVWRKLAADKSPRVRTAAVEALTDTKLLRGAALREALEQERHAEVLSSLIQACVVARLRSAAPAIVGLLKRPQGWLRWQAAWALAELGNAKCIPALQALVDDTTPGEVTIEVDGKVTAHPGAETVGQAARKAIRAIRRRSKPAP